MYKSSILFLTYLALVLLVSCQSNPKSYEAEVSSAVPSNEEHSAGNKKYILADSCYIRWVGTKPTGRHTGIIPISSGFISLSEEGISGKLKLRIDSINVDDFEDDPVNRNKLLKHLRSIDFFYIEKYPIGSFEIVDYEEYVEPDSLAAIVSEFKLPNPTHLITGNLTIRDTTLSIKFPALIVINEDESTVQAKAKFNIDRTRWGISYEDERDLKNRAKDQFIYNKVNISFNVIATR